MSYEILKYSIQEKIGIIKIDRPNALNALNLQFFREMNLLLDEIITGKDGENIRVLVITGEGKAFVAGADISEMKDMNSEQAREFSKTGQSTFRRLESLDVPVIAAINGFALGGGCELALACDIRVASSKAKFGQPEVNLGLIPGYGGTQRLPRLVGIGNALHILMTGDMISADEALRMGLVQKVTEPEQLMETVMQMAKKIASRGPVAVKRVKSVTRQGLLNTFEMGCALEKERFGDTFGNEGTEGMHAFLEKREPNW